MVMIFLNKPEVLVQRLHLRGLCRGRLLELLAPGVPSCSSCHQLLLLLLMLLPVPEPEVPCLRPLPSPDDD